MSRTQAIAYNKRRTRRSEHHYHDGNMNAFLVLLLAATASARPSLKYDFIRPTIIGGENAGAGEFPWQLSMERYGSHSCGAVLISNNGVTDRALTAAHCIQDSDPADITVRYDTIIMGEGKQEAVESLVWHENFVSDGSQGFPNDIGILRFGKALTGTNVAPITPAAKGSDFGNQRCLISGWGDTTGDGTLSLTLQKKNIKVLTDADCENIVPVADRTMHVCVDGDDGNSSCNGDSGGPLNCGDKLVGLTSFGLVGCVGHPGVYTRVSNYLDWISQNINA